MRKALLLATVLLAACGQTSASAPVTASPIPASSSARISAPSTSPQPSDWRQLPYYVCAAAGNCPPAASGIAFDPDQSEFITFGGWRPSTDDTSETWRYKNGRWTQLNPMHVPIGRLSPVMVFDQALGKIVMYGGEDVPASAAAGWGGEVGGIPFAADTWTWDGSDWTEQHPAHHPVLFVPDGTYDYARDQVLLLGFYQSGIETTWTYDGIDWTHHAVADLKPDPPRIQTALCFDNSSESVLTFGGHNDGGADLTQVWRWDGKTWTQTAAHTPVKNFGRNCVPEPDKASMLLYDGSFWRWNGTDFAQLQPQHSPTIEGGLFLDSPRHEVLFFGAHWPQTDYQVWSWTGSDWTPTSV